LNFGGKTMNFTKTLLIIALLTIVGAVGLTASAEDLTDNLSITAEVRARAEGHDTDFNSDTKMYSFGLLRTRINLDLYQDSPVRGFIQLQDSRVYGQSGSGSGTLENDENLGLHQGYLRVACKYIDHMYMKIGRFEFPKGNERVLGAVGWNNVGRTFDGATVGFDNENVHIQGFGMMIDERYVQSNDDVMLWGVHAEIKDPDIDFFLLWDRDNLRDSEDVARTSRLTAGLYRQGEFSQFDYNSNLAYQFGKSYYDALDIAAYLVTLEIGYTFETEKYVRVAAGIDMTSGDDDPADDKDNTYNNLYYTAHKFRGHMDLFTGSPMHGLNDLFFKGEFRPDDMFSFNGHFHYFMSNVDYSSVVDGSDTKSIGTEIDIFAKIRPYDRFTLQVGGSTFMASEDWLGEDADASYWLYLQTTASF